MGAQGSSDFFGGLGHGFAAILGLGSEFDPMSDLRSQLATANSNLQAIQNVGAYNGLKEDIKINTEFQEMMMDENKLMTESSQYYNNVALDNIKQTDLFLTLLALLVIVVVFFMLARK